MALKIEPMGACVPVQAEQTLVAAARAAGIRLPSSCRNGTCRACMCRLVEGQIVYRIDWPGLSAEEKREGFILPCVAYAVGDVTVHAPHARLSPPPA